MNIVITGASSGIGRMLAENLQASKVFMLYNTNDEGIRLTAENMKCEYEIFKCNVSNDDQVKRTFNLIDHIDVLINNAGTIGDALVKNMTEEKWDNVLDVNLKGAFLCSKYAIPKMSQNSHIINISSVVARAGVIGACNYAASKGGLESFTKSLAMELVKDGIFANCISLGFFEIGLGTRLPQKVRDNTLERIPLHLFGDPMEIVKAVEFIIGSKYLVGSVINLNGGYYL
ncbi:SDR family oxidoreductase [Chloroflexota bacterium]